MILHAIVRCARELLQLCYFIVAVHKHYTTTPDSCDNDGILRASRGKLLITLRIHSENNRSPTNLRHITVSGKSTSPGASGIPSGMHGILDTSPVESNRMLPASVKTPTSHFTGEHSSGDSINAIDYKPFPHHRAPENRLNTTRIARENRMPCASVSNYPTFLYESGTRAENQALSKSQNVHPRLPCGLQAKPTPTRARSSCVSFSHRTVPTVKFKHAQSNPLNLHANLHRSCASFVRKASLTNILEAAYFSRARRSFRSRLLTPPSQQPFCNPVVNSHIARMSSISLTPCIDPSSNLL